MLRNTRRVRPRSCRDVGGHFDAGETLDDVQQPGKRSLRNVVFSSSGDRRELPFTPRLTKHREKIFYRALIYIYIYIYAYTCIYIYTTRATIGERLYFFTYIALNHHSVNNRLVYLLSLNCQKTSVVLSRARTMGISYIRASVIANGKKNNRSRALSFSPSLPPSHTLVCLDACC